MSDLKKLAIVQTQSKSMAAGIFLTLFFGGFGLLYAGVILGLIGIFIELVILALSFFTFGLGGLLLVPWHILAVLITMFCISSHNKKLISSLD